MYGVLEGCVPQERPLYQAYTWRLGSWNHCTVNGFEDTGGCDASLTVHCSTSWGPHTSIKTQYAGTYVEAWKIQTSIYNSFGALRTKWKRTEQKRPQANVFTWTMCHSKLLTFYHSCPTSLRLSVPSDHLAELNQTHTHMLPGTNIYTFLHIQCIHADKLCIWTNTDSHVALLQCP